jgi:hypothetical protein
MMNKKDRAEGIEGLFSNVYIYWLWGVFVDERNGGCAMDTLLCTRLSNQTNALFPRK